MPVYSTFRDFDLDGSGEINVDELAKAFAKLGTEMSKAPLPPLHRFTDSERSEHPI